MGPEFVAWPFPVLKPEAEWDEFDHDYLDFMRAAYAEGYRPRKEKQGSAIEAGDPAGRTVFLVFRGRRNGWEPWLSEGARSVRLGPSYHLPLGDCACVCIRPPFRAAAHLALEWLRGRSLESLLGDFVFVGGSPAGIELRLEVACPSLVLSACRAGTGAAPDPAARSPIWAPEPAAPRSVSLCHERPGGPWPPAAEGASGKGQGMPRIALDRGSPG
jgi:hypothetical protein